MADAIHGKQLFKGLLEYRLPKVTGTRDYVFYFVPNEGYGEAARLFFDKYYAGHVAHEVRSLEQLIGRLHADVTQHGVQHIREVVIVSHGTPLALLFPLLNQTNNQNLSVLTAYALALLQSELGDHPALRTQREAVVAHLRPDSWVTVRACRFGASEAGMYALYSFFGGRANVYAPIPYQFFGYQPMIEGARYPTRLAMHEHLVRQRLLPKDLHTPDRQDAVVRALADPGLFSTPFVLSSEALGGGGVPEYENLVDTLNAKQVNSTLRSKLHDNGFDLTAGAKTKVLARDLSWVVRDTIRDGAASFPVEFQIGEQVDLTTNTRTLLGQAHLPAVHTAERVLWQGFFEDGHNDLYVGRVFRLAQTHDDDQANSPNRIRFEALHALLRANGVHGQTLSDGSVDLRDDFAEEGRTLAAAAAIDADGPLPADTWKIGPDADGVRYLIKLTHTHTPTTDQVRGAGWTVVHTLHVSLDLDKRALARHQAEVLAYIGTDLDAPGVELAASMDRLSIDDLVDLITHLREPYTPRNSIYLDQAHQAIKRKAEFDQWWQSRFPDPTQAPFPSADPLTELSLGEAADKKAMVYDFRFGGNWAEVKASSRNRFAFAKDLFEEEPLAKRFRIPDLGNRTATTFDADSPFLDVAELRRLESLGLNQFVASTQKQEFVAPAVAELVSCADFRAAVMRLKDFANAPVEQLAAELAGQTTADGTSYLDIVMELRSKYSMLRNIVALGGLSDFVKLPSIPDPTSPYDVPKAVAGFVVKRLNWELGINFMKDLGRIDIAITVPWKLWKHFLELQLSGAEQWKATGRIVAVRAWLRRLIILTRQRESDFPDDVEFDLTVHSFTGMSYYVGAWDFEWDEVDGDRNALRWVFFDDDLKEGFDEGAAALNRSWPTLRRYADEAVDEVLRVQGLDSCRAQALIDAGFLEPRAIRAVVLRSIAEQLLRELPHV